MLDLKWMHGGSVGQGGQLNGYREGLIKGMRGQAKVRLIRANFLFAHPAGGGGGNMNQGYNSSGGYGGGMGGGNSMMGGGNRRY